LSGNPVPWLILIAIVAAVLIAKGYLKLPSLARSLAQPASGLRIAEDLGKTALDAARGNLAAVAQDAATTLVDVGKLTAQELGVLMAQKAQAEAHAELATQLAHDAASTIKATFQAPFSPAAATASSPAAPTPGGA
jgi:hypothetical protein